MEHHRSIPRAIRLGEERCHSFARASQAAREEDPEQREETRPPVFTRNVHHSGSLARLTASLGKECKHHDTDEPLGRLDTLAEPFAPALDFREKAPRVGLVVLRETRDERGEVRVCRSFRGKVEDDVGCASCWGDGMGAIMREDGRIDFTLCEREGKDWAFCCDEEGETECRPAESSG